MPLRLTLVIILCFLSSCVYTDNYESKDLNRNQYQVFGKVYETMSSAEGYLEIGVASWYGKKVHGNLTASGEIYDMRSMTAAHRALPLPTLVKVTNLENGKKTVVKVNDRGPFYDDRLIDLSYAAALELGFAKQGVTTVVVEAIKEAVPVKGDKPKDGPDWSYVQVGAFKTNAAAVKLSNKLSGLLPKIVSVRVISPLENSGLHKVWVGPLAEEKQKLHVLEIISDEGFEGPLYIKE